MPKVGRPSTYTKATAADICAKLASGHSLRSICQEEGKPDIATVYRWMAAHDEFRELYARAREDQADTLADEILAIADEDPATRIQGGEGEGDDKDLRVVIDGAAVQHQKLRVEARKWIAAKLKPKKYGDKVEHSGKFEHEHTTPSLAVVAAALGISTQSAIAPPKDAGHTPAPKKTK